MNRVVLPSIIVLVLAGAGALFFATQISESGQRFDEATEEVRQACLDLFKVVRENLQIPGYELLEGTQARLDECIKRGHFPQDQPVNLATPPEAITPPVALTVPATPTEESKPIQKVETQIVDEFVTKDILGFMHVVGEVQNIGDVNARDVRVSIVFRDRYGFEVARDSAFVFVQILKPGDKSLYDLSSTSKRAVTFDEVMVDLSATTQDPIERLTVESYSNFDSQITTDLIVNGEVRNVGEQTVRRIAVAVVLKNEGSIIALPGYALIDPVNLQPGQTGEFSVSHFFMRTGFNGEPLYVWSPGLVQGGAVAIDEVFLYFRFQLDY